jgi:uncharacterized protein YbjQ (UPF0145 family)
MITTTTSSIPNAEITEIISVVHNRIVLGTNLFSDISAGFSDIFGGNNSAYEKRLAEITNQVIEGLKEKAKKIKADALIDLKIDVDEIFESLLLNKLKELYKDLKWDFPSLNTNVAKFFAF